MWTATVTAQPPRNHWLLATLLCLMALAAASCARPAASQPAPADQAEKPAAKDPSNPPADAGQPQQKDAPVADKPDQLEDPFPQRVRTPDFPRDLQWLNTSGPLRKADLKGKLVLLDFWTYCCINCMHVLPELKKLERAFPQQLVVIGVHSAKFETERVSRNIRQAILRYEISHPVVNDAHRQIWRTFGVQSWPTLILVDPQGYAIWGRSGEVRFETLRAVVDRAVRYYRARKLLDETPVHFDLLAHRQQPTPLRFPGKVLADEASGRLFVADSNHNRIVVCSLEGKLLDVIGRGSVGRQDGTYDEACFNHPQGMALHGQMLYVADTENHLIRKVDLARRQVATIAGLGHQARSPWPGLDRLGPNGVLPDRWAAKPLETALNSPWALHVHRDALYIAMAGPHQIWKMPLDESEIGPYAGNGREDIVDGPLLPREPYGLGAASFAQPSGLTSDSKWLYVADSEGSSIRAVPFDPQGKVRTVVGTADLPAGRLFHFGDADGPPGKALLQHPLGVAFHDGVIYVADTYNNKIKAVDAATGHTRTVAGTGRPGRDDAAPTFDEPAGLSVAAGRLYVADTNNHLIRTIDLASSAVSTLTISGLKPPAPADKPQRPTFPDARRIKLPPVAVHPVDGQIQLHVELSLPRGWKLNPLAPPGYFVETPQAGPVDRAALPQTLVRLDQPAEKFTIPLPVTGTGSQRLQVAVTYYFCQEDGAGLCKVGSVVWDVPVEVVADGANQRILLRHEIQGR